MNKQTSILERSDVIIEGYGKAPWSVLHPFSTEDQVVMTAMRTIVTPNKGKLQGPAPGFHTMRSWGALQRPQALFTKLNA